MAFPSIANSATTDGGTASNAPVVNLPANIAAGDLLMCLLRVAVGGAIGWPAGWNEVFDASSDNADDQMAFAWKLAAGNEGNNMACNCTSGKFGAIAWRITGADDPTIQAPELSTVAVGTSNAPNPTACTPTGGAKDYLWIWMGGWDNEVTSPPTGNPTNYSGVLQANSGTAGAVTTNVRLAAASRTANAASEDASAWNISGNANWTAYCVAVHPVNPIQQIHGNSTGLASANGNLTGIGALVGASSGTSTVSGTMEFKPGIIGLSGSNNIAGGGNSNTTVQLTSPSGKNNSNFQIGKISDDTNPVASLDLGSDNYTEIEFCVKASNNAINDEIYQFRITANGTVLDFYNNGTPEWTIGLAMSAISGSSTGTGAATGILTGIGQLIGNTAGIAALAGNLIGEGALIGNSIGASTPTGLLIGTGALTGNSNGIGATVGNLIGTGDLAGASAGTSTAAGDLTAMAGAFSLAASNNIAAGGNSTTTYQLDPPSGKNNSNFQAGKISDDTNPLPDLDLISGNYTEIEFCVKASSSLADNDIYQFRITDNGTVLDFYNNGTPEWTIGAMVSAISGMSAGTSAVSGTLVGTGNLSGNTAGLSSQSGNLTGIGALIANSVGISALTATLLGSGSLAGNSTGLGTATGSLIAAGSGAISGSSVGSSIVTGTIKGTGALAGQSAGVATTSGVLIADGRLVGASAGIGAATGTGRLVKLAIGNSAGASSPTGVLKGTGALAGQSTGSATATANLAGIAPLAGQSSGTSSVSGTLNGIGSGAMSGASVGQSTAIGTLTGLGAISGASHGISSPSATLTGEAMLAGMTAGFGDAMGILTGIGALAGMAEGTSTAWLITIPVIVPTCRILGTSYSDDSMTIDYQDRTLIVEQETRNTEASNEY